MTFLRGTIMALPEKLTKEQFDTLKELYVERLVDNMSTKDLVQYVMTDISEWVDGLGYTEAMIEFENYWEEYFTDTIQEVIEGQI
tara:strand:+ start:340 stop:594 length:255 start_codon:yes stop_codon:yes gene_type:complete